MQRYPFSTNECGAEAHWFIVDKASLSLRNPLQSLNCLLAYTKSEVSCLPKPSQKELKYLEASKTGV